MTVGDRIRQRRMQLGLTQDELAKRLGYKDRSAVCRVESAGDSLSNKRVMKIANALNTSAAVLYGWEDAAPPEMYIDGDPYTEEERRIIEAYRMKTFMEKEAFRTLLGLSGGEKNDD